MTTVMKFFVSETWFVIYWILFVVSYLFRDSPVFKQIWWFYKWTLITLFAVLFVNFAKKEVKEWWNK
jgi:hypothetical protein